MAENKATFIADASVLLKWVVNEPENQEEALLFKKHFVDSVVEIIVPAYCFAEIGNFLGRFRQDIATSFLTYLITSEIMECACTLKTITRSLHLMEKHQTISFYDAGYHALAIEENGTFLTADKKYYQKTKRAGHIMLLKDYAKRR